MMRWYHEATVCYAYLEDVAGRMSWASERQTSRPEDQAYSLLGIFGINIPLLYGEGSAAFLRLQEEIIKHLDDNSLLTWNWRNGQPKDIPRLPGDIPTSGVFAHSPASFQDCNGHIP